MIRVEDFSRLTDSEWRQHYEAEHGIFVAEGNKVIKRALAAGLQPLQVLCQEKWLTEFSVYPNLPVEVLSEEALAEVVGFKFHRGALACFARPAPLSLEQLLSLTGDGAALVVCDSVVDHENVGAIFRNAAALGAGGVILTEGCVDPWYRRSLRVSMGTVFELPFCIAPRREAVLQELAAHGVTQVALSIDGDDSLQLLPAGGPIAFWLGSEGDGLPAVVESAADFRCAIPMSRGVDSINVATALAVALWSRREMR